MGEEAKAREADRRMAVVAEQHVPPNPDDVEALLFGAGASIRLGEKEKGLEWTNRVLTLEPEDPTVLYNAACNFSLAGDVQKGLETLERAVSAGFAGKGWIEEDNGPKAPRAHPRGASIP